MNERQRRFAEAWLINPNNEAAALEAGYSKSYARHRSHLIRHDPEVSAYIDKRLAEMSAEKVASVSELLEYLTSVVRNKNISEVVVVEGTGRGYSKARRMPRLPTEKEKLKAAELLLKRLETHEGDEEGAVTVIDDIS